MKKILLNLQFIFRPSYWIMNNKYDKNLDVFMNKLMDAHQFKPNGLSSYTAHLGGIEIWIGNHPYASMIPYCSGFMNPIRPSRITILRAYKKLQLDLKGDTPIDRLYKLTTP